MNNSGIVNHKIYGFGSVVAMNRTEDQNLRLLVVWKDVEQASVLAGWYIMGTGEIEVYNPSNE